jgi:hypothetical protein
MTQQNENLPALGDDEPTPDGADDFAGEHADTAVDPAAVERRDGEQESPRDRSGMGHEGPP